MDVRGPGILLRASILALLTAACGDGPGAGSVVTLQNDRGSMIRSVALVTGGDTLRTDTLQAGESASWSVRMDTVTAAQLAWVEGATTLSLAPVLLDSAFAAREIRFTLLPGELDLEIAYRF